MSPKPIDFYGHGTKSGKGYKARRQSAFTGRIPKGIWMVARPSLAASFVISAR